MNLTTKKKEILEELGIIKQDCSGQVQHLANCQGCPEIMTVQVDDLREALDSIALAAREEAIKDVEKSFYHGAIFNQNDITLGAKKQLTVHECVWLTDAALALVRSHLKEKQKE